MSRQEEPTAAEVLAHLPSLQQQQKQFQQDTSEKRRMVKEESTVKSAPSQSRSRKSKSQYSGLRVRQYVASSSSSEGDTSRNMRKDRRLIAQESSDEEEVYAVSFYERKKGPRHPLIDDFAQPIRFLIG